MSDDDWGNDGDDGGWGDDAGGDDDGWGNAEVDGDGGWGANDDVDMDTGGGGEMTLEDQIANAFYEGEDERRDDPASAVGKFKQVIALGEEAQKGDSQPSLDTISAIFNSMGHLAMAYLQLHNIEEMVKYLDMMVAFSVNVSRNDATATVDRVLGAVDTDGDGDFKLVKQVYTSIIDGLQKLQDYEQIIFKYRLKLVNTLVARLAFPEAEEELDALHQTLKRADGSDKSEPSEKCSAQLIEVYVLRYVLAKAQGKQIDGKALFDSTYRLQGAINNPKSMSVIRQVWGQMFGDQGHWNKAYLEFFSAFRDLVELGDSANAKRCLQCVVVSNMLSKEGQVNPFDAREAKIYQTDKDLVPFSTLRTAFEKSDVTLFAGALEDIRVCADEWVITHLGSMVTDFRKRAILKSCKCYRRVYLAKLAERLKIDADVVEQMVVQLILSNEISGRINQVDGVLDLGASSDGEISYHGKLSDWAKVLEKNMPDAGRARNKRSGRFGSFGMDDDMDMMGMDYGF